MLEFLNLQLQLWLQLAKFFVPVLILVGITYLTMYRSYLKHETN